MARESLSADVEIEKTDYGIKLWRDDADEHIKLCNYEIEDLVEHI